MDKDLKNRLIAIRQNLGLSSRQIALKIGADPSYYAKAEKGGSLSNQYLDEVSEMAGIEIAKRIAGHTNINTTKIYTIGESSRQSE